MQDRILVYRADGRDWRECVACAWREARPQAVPTQGDRYPHPEDDAVRLIGPPGSDGQG